MITPTPEGFALDDMSQVEVRARVALIGRRIKEWAPDWLIDAPAPAGEGAPFTASEALRLPSGG